MTLIEKSSNLLEKLISTRSVLILSVLCAIFSTWYSYAQDIIVAYGDAESHLNIAKRVVDSITPGFAQLGGIWLPLPHLLLVPLVKFDFLWRTGLAGSIVSGLAFVISSIFIYKLTLLLTKHKLASFIAALIFMFNPNVLYLQSTPMTELTLIMFFVLSSYYFIKFIEFKNNLTYLILAALFGFAATLSRYDGWFLVSAEALILALLFWPFKKTGEFFTRFKKMEGHTLLFVTLAFFGIALWFVWGFLILGDPLYFTHSEFSAKSQQSGWLMRGELPAYKNLGLSFLYYFLTSLDNVGIWLTGLAIIGFLWFIFYKPNKEKFFVAILLNIAFIFYVATLYMGQSIIFIPQLTPNAFEWDLFNVRYGVMMVAPAAIFIAYLFSRVPRLVKIVLSSVVCLQLAIFATGSAGVISREDGVVGLSHATRPDAERWIRENYDSGRVLMDDYARTVSVVRSGIPMQEMIYVGNKPHWEESLKNPEKTVEWVIVQNNDTIWKELIEKQDRQAHLYTYFEKVYTSPEILIFRKNRLSQN